MAKGGYCGVSSVAHKLKKAYCGVGGVAHKIKKGYIGDANGKARLFWAGAGNSGWVFRSSNALATTNDDLGEYAARSVTPTIKGGIAKWDNKYYYADSNYNMCSLSTLSSGVGTQVATKSQLGIRSSFYATLIYWAFAGCIIPKVDDGSNVYKADCYDVQSNSVISYTLNAGGWESYVLDKLTVSEDGSFAVGICVGSGTKPSDSSVRLCYAEASTFAINHTFTIVPNSYYSMCQPAIHGNTVVFPYTNSSSSTQQILYSTNRGQTWTSITLSLTGVTGWICGACGYFGGKFHCYGQTNHVSSTDGITWSGEWIKSGSFGYYSVSTIQYNYSEDKLVIKVSSYMNYFTKDSPTVLTSTTVPSAGDFFHDAEMAV